MLKIGMKYGLEDEFRSIPSKLGFFGKSLKLLSVVVNHAPFALHENSIQLFESKKRKYRDLTGRGNSIISEYKQTGSVSRGTGEFIQDLNPHVKEIGEHINRLLASAIQDAKEDSLIHRKWVVLDQAYKSRVEIDEQISALKETLQDLRARITEISGSEECLKTEVSDEIFETLAKIKKVKGAMSSFELPKDQNWEQNLPALTQEDFLELIFLNEALKTDAIEEAAFQILNVNLFSFDQHVKRIELLKAELKGGFNQAVRWCRIKEVYRLWEDNLKNKKLLTDQRLIVAIENIKLLTYEKKAFFKQVFSSQKASNIAKQMMGKSYDEIAKEKEKLKKTVYIVEKGVQQNQTYTQALFARLVLSLTEQPDYILGKTVAKGSASALNSVPIRILNEDLSKIKVGRTNLEELTAHATGLGYLALTLWLTKLVGSHYSFLIALSRALTQQIDYMICLGGYFDKITSSINIRFDELGLLEKDRYINWLVGLLLSLVINYSRVIPAIFGYVFGTVCGYIAGKIVNIVAQRLNLNKTANNTARVISHTVAFSLGYRYGYKLGNHYFPPSSQLMTSQEAFTILGLDKSASTKEIKDAYYKLSFEKHPDRVRKKDAAYYEANEDQIVEEFSKINQAHELLIKTK